MYAIVLLIALLATGYTKASATCGRKLDILFLVDGSSTVCDGDQTCPAWTSTLEFCKNIAKSFKIGRDDTKIAFILMSGQFNVKWNLDGHTNLTALLTAIDSVAYTGGTFTILSLPSSLSLLTQVFNSYDGDRSDALDVVIMITDGIPAIPALLGSALSTAYQLLRYAAFAVCVRPRCTEDWVRGMTAPPQKVNETYFMAESYFLLDPTRDNLVNEICPYQLSLLSGLIPAL